MGFCQYLNFDIYQSLVSFDPSIVYQIGWFLVRLLLSRSVRSPFVCFISSLSADTIMAKLTNRNRPD